MKKQESPLIHIDKLGQMKESPLIYIDKLGQMKKQESARIDSIEMGTVDEPSFRRLLLSSSQILIKLDEHF